MVPATHMGSVYAVKRSTKAGEPRWHIRYQRDSWDRTPAHLGVARTTRERDAIIRRARLLVAEGVEPNRELMKPASTRHKGVTFGEAANRWLDSRVDLAERSIKAYRSQMRIILTRWGDVEAASITRSGLAEWISTLQLHPRTIGTVLNLVRWVLDEADVTPNPARDARLRAPRIPRTTLQLPTRTQYEALLDTIRPDVRILVQVLLHTGMRISELCALLPDARDHVHGPRLLVRGTKTKASTRWIPDLHEGAMAYPADAVAWLDQLQPISLSHHAIRHAFEHAGPIRPHTLRHLNASILVHEGWPAIRVAERLGHANAGLVISLYGHVSLPSDWLDGRK